MPNLEIEKVQKTLLISTLLPLSTFIISLLFAEDGPRNLILKGEETKALAIIQKIKGNEMDQDTRDIIINQTKSNSNKSTEKTSFMDIFNKDYCRTTVLLTFIRCNHAIYYFGILLISSLTLHKLGIENQKTDNRHIIIDEIYVVTMILISDFVSGIQTEMKFFARKMTMMVNYAICAINMILCVIFSQYFSHFLSVALFFSSITSIVNHTYCLEVYHTRIRDKALGFLFAWRRFGGFLSQVVYIHLDKMDMWLPYYFTAIVIAINIVLLYFLPYETYNTALDTNLKEPQKESSKDGFIKDEECAKLL